MALRFLRQAKADKTLKFDLGVRVRDSKVRVFALMGGFVRYSLPKGWSGTVSNNLIYYSDDDYDNRLAFKFEHPVGDKGTDLYASSTQFGWERDYKGVLIQHTTGLYQKISSRTSVAVEGLFNIRTTPLSDQRRFESAGIRFRMRQNAFRPWFFYEIWPGINWLSYRDYDTAYSVQLKAEVIFGGNYFDR